MFSLIVLNILIRILVHFFGPGFQSSIVIRGHYYGISKFQTSHLVFLFPISSVSALGLVYLGFAHWLSFLVATFFQWKY